MVKDHTFTFFWGPFPYSVNYFSKNTLNDILETKAIMFFFYYLIPILKVAQKVVVDFFSSNIGIK